MLVMALFLLLFSSVPSFAEEEQGEPVMIDPRETAEAAEQKEEEQPAKRNSYDSRTVLDDDFCRVEVLDADLDEQNGWSVTVRCTNKTEERLAFEWGNSVVSDDVAEYIWEEVTAVSPGAVKQYGFYSSEITDANRMMLEVTVRSADETLAAGEAVIVKINDDTFILEEENSPIVVDFDALLERNGEIAGWLYCPETVISYPVVDAVDNSFYLHKDIDLNYSAYGTLFTEALGGRNFDNDNTVIYGHHMNDGKMFAGIVNYARQDYYDRHPTLYLNTPEVNYRIDLFAGFLTDMYSSAYTCNFLTEEEMQDWLDDVTAQSAFRSEVSVSPGDKIITLSTCTYEYDTARYVVMGRMVPIR